jgi:hypothetical protein
MPKQPSRALTRYTWGKGQLNEPGTEVKAPTMHGWTVLKMVTTDTYAVPTVGGLRANPGAEWSIQAVVVAVPELTELKSRAIAMILNSEEPF